MKRLIVLISMLLLLYVSLAGQKQIKPPVQPVSIVQLLTNPSKYDGRSVGVRGFYHQEFESSGLYLCSEHAKYGLKDSAIWIGTRSQGATNEIAHVNDSYVYVQGVFNHIPAGGGHGAMGTGELNRLTLLVPLRPKD